MKKIFLKFIKYFSIGISSVILLTVSIDAVDNMDNMSESLVGRLVFGESQGVCPSNMVYVQASWGEFCIDKYEASAGKNCPYPLPQSSLESNRNNDHPNCFALSAEEAFPWTYISRDQAAYACAKAGKRLPSNREWSAAALGTPDSQVQWGEDDCQIEKNWKDQPGMTGSGKKCYSFAGAYDMIGNVWEWVDDSVTDGQANSRNLPSQGYVGGINQDDGFPSITTNEPSEEYKNDFFWIKNTGARTTARGGYFDNGLEAGQYAHYIVSNPSDTGGATGFRCASNILK